MISVFTLGAASVSPLENESTAKNLEGAEVRASFRQTYHEIADCHVVETDVIEQLRANLSQLEDMQARMSFLIGEVSYLLKKI